MEQKAKQYEAYLNATHKLGRWLTVLVLVLLLAAPFAIGLYLGAMPNLGAAVKAFLGVGLVYLVSGIVEYLIYVPMLGAGGTYLSFVTGNISNLKLPVALDALERAKVKPSSEEGEIVSTISIAVSSIVTTVIIIIGVILIVPLTPILENPALTAAFDQMLPALFGGLGVVFVSKNPKLAIAPIILMLTLFIAIDALNQGTVGVMVPVGVLFTIAVARILYKKGKL